MALRESALEHKSPFNVCLSLVNMLVIYCVGARRLLGGYSLVPWDPLSLFGVLSQAAGRLDELDSKEEKGRELEHNVNTNIII